MLDRCGHRENYIPLNPSRAGAARKTDARSVTGVALLSCCSLFLLRPHRAAELAPPRHPLAMGHPAPTWPLTGQVSLHLSLGFLVWEIMLVPTFEGCAHHQKGPETASFCDGRQSHVLWAQEDRTSIAGSEFELKGRKTLPAAGGGTTLERARTLALEAGERRCDNPRSVSLASRGPRRCDAWGLSSPELP